MSLSKKVTYLSLTILLMNFYSWLIYFPWWILSCKCVLIKCNSKKHTDLYILRSYVIKIWSIALTTRDSVRTCIFKYFFFQLLIHTVKYSIVSLQLTWQYVTLFSNLTSWKKNYFSTFSYMSYLILEFNFQVRHYCIILSVHSFKLKLIIH